MSQDHIEELNTRFAASVEVRAATAKLVRDVLWVHRLHEDLNDRIIWWQTLMSPSKGIVLSLEPPARTPELLMSGNYYDAVALTQAAVRGESLNVASTIEIGDENFMDEVADVHAVAWRVGMMDLEYPTRPVAQG